MYQQTGLFFYKFRSLFVGLSTIAFFVLISALITAVGSNSILDSKTHASASLLNSSMPDDSANAVTNSAYSLMDGTKRVVVLAGASMYSVCRSITNTSAQASKTVVRGSAAVTGGIWNGTTLVARGFGSSIMFVFHTTGSAVMFTVRLPGKTVGSVTSGHTVSAIIRPADDDKSVPVISSETTAAILASVNEQQREQITQWQAAQLVANRGLDGSVVAGDPHHGGYPAKWDAPVRQDSLLDSWGMYNRECVSYAAWKVFQTYGHMPYWGGVGNANQWVRDARKAAVPTGSTPQVHSVAISMQGYYGHAMWVEAVKGNMIYVSQYNYDLHGHYSEMWVNGNSFAYIYFK